MSKLFNLARMTVTGTPGTGTITLNAATANHITFASAGVADGDSVSYGIEDGTASETGLGTYTSAGTSLTRNLDKSTTGSLLSLTSAAEVFITPSARDLVATTQLGAGLTLINGKLVATVAASALTVALKTLAGADPSLTDPVRAVFRNVTSATGDYAIIDIIAPTSVVAPSTQTFGTPSGGIPFRVWTTGWNDGGTFRLGVSCQSNSAVILPLFEHDVGSSLQVVAAGNALGQIYTNGAAVTSKAYTILGYMDWATGLTTAGTWASGPTLIRLFSPGCKKPGDIVQNVFTSSPSVATGTTTIPIDNTIPQNTEGDQYISQAMTPRSAANRLRITGQVTLSNSGASEYMQVALFQDAVANALTASVDFMATATAILMIPIYWEMISATSSSTTFKIRAGGNAAGTTSFNGSGGIQVYGGVANSFLRIEELMG